MSLGGENVRKDDSLVLVRWKAFWAENKMSTGMAPNDVRFARNGIDPRHAV